MADDQNNQVDPFDLDEYRKKRHEFAEHLAEPIVDLIPKTDVKNKGPFKVLDKTPIGKWLDKYFPKTTKKAKDSIADNVGSWIDKNIINREELEKRLKDTGAYIIESTVNANQLNQLYYRDAVNNIAGVEDDRELIKKHEDEQKYLNKKSGESVEELGKFAKDQIVDNEHLDTLKSVLIENGDSIVDAAEYLGEKATGVYHSLFNKSDSSNQSVFKLGIEHNVGKTVDGSVIDLPSSESLYDPVTEDINYDPTQRIQGGGGGSASINDLESATSNPEMPASSDPASKMNSKLKTPNMESIKNTLYGKAQKYATSYLRNRRRELVFGKKLTKKLQKVDKARGYYNTTKALAKTYAKNQWNAASKAVSTAAKAAWSSVSQSAFGHALGSAASWVGSQLTALWAGLTNIPVIGAAIAAIGSAVATVAGWALTALAFLAW